VVEKSVREMSASDEAERLAWSVLQTVNRTQAKGSTVRIIVPSDPEVADELGRELGVGPGDDELLSAEDYLLGRGYVAPVDIGLTRSTYTITPAGMSWLERGLLQQPGDSRKEPPGDKSGPSAGPPVAEHEDLRRRLELAELAESRLREERDRLVRELEAERDERMKLEGELARARRSWWREVFGG
jgi:hypothetical protein